ncbi:hypothetical protein, conserved [Eimeria brunetti]|uniref:Uncharacterized protein n=1 Tax=Eimeria brunetti TaxID=51314 RepID=U6L723_9EIME|nr:hypothetical protein, conserved [Eimeria brunetti]
MELFSIEQLPAAGPRALVNNGELWGSHTAQERHSEAAEARPSLLLRPHTDKRFEPSILHLLAATITSLAVVYLVLRCFEKTLSHRQGAAFRSLGTETNGAEDECSWIEESEEDEQADDNDQGTSSDGPEAFLAIPGTSFTTPPPAAYSADAAWGYGAPATSGGAGRHIEPVDGYRGAVEDITEEETVLVGVEEESKPTTTPLGRGGNGIPREIDPLTTMEIRKGFWQNRILTRQAREQLRRLLDGVRSHACACYELLPHVGQRQMLRLTVAVMKVLSMQLGVLSLTPDSAMENLRKQAGWAVVDLGNRALELSVTEPNLQHHREDVADMLFFTLAVVNPRPPGEGLSPEKYKYKILGILGFNAVLNWYMQGILLGMQYHVGEHGSPLPNEFVGNNIHLLHILQRHHAKRVINDTRARWFCVYCQRQIQKMTFFFPVQLTRAGQVPIASVAEFSADLREDINRAGGLPYAAMHDVKYIGGAPETGVRLGRLGDYLLLHFEGDASHSENLPSISAGASHQRMPEMQASPTPPPGEAGTWEFDHSEDPRGVGSSPGSWHSPWTLQQAHVDDTWNELDAQHHNKPQQQLSHLQASPESAESHAQPPKPTELPSLRAPNTGAECPPGHSQEKTSPTPLTFPSWVPSSAGDFAGVYRGAAHKQVSAETLRAPDSAPWGHSGSVQQTEISFQQLSPATESLRHHSGFETSSGQPPETMDSLPGTQHPTYLPTDEVGATSMNIYLQQGLTLTEGPPGAPVTRGPHEVSSGLERWVQSTRMQAAGQSSQRAPKVGHPPEVERPEETVAAHAFGATTRWTLPPQMEEGRSPVSSRPSSPEFDIPDAEPPLSIAPRYAFDNLKLSFASPSQTPSQHLGTTASHTSPQPSSIPPDVLHSRFEQVGSPTEAASPETLLEFRSRGPVFPSPSTESAGLAVPPTPQHGGAAGIGELEAALGALVAEDIISDNHPGQT